MLNLKKIVLGTAAILLPGGLLIAAGYFAYAKYKDRRKNGVEDEIRKESDDQKHQESTGTDHS